MIRKLCLMLILVTLGALTVDSVFGDEYITTYHDYITSSFTVAADSSDSGFQYDTSNYQWYNIVGSYVNVRYRFHTDTVFTAGCDTYFVYIDCTPDKGDADSANLYQNLHVNIDNSPATTWEYSAFQLDLTDSTNAWENWKVYFTNTDTLTAAQAASQAGEIYADTLEIWIEVWK
jgi:hypothetical protein